MIIDRRHIHILEVLSVILFSVFGSYLVAVDPAFNKSVSLVEVCRLVSVLSSGVFLYFAVFKMKKLDEEARVDFHSEADLSKKAERSIDERYAEYFFAERPQILFRLFSAVLFLLVFASLEFLPNQIREHLDFEIHSAQSEDAPAPTRCSPTGEGVVNSEGGQSEGLEG